MLTQAVRRFGPREERERALHPGNTALTAALAAIQGRLMRLHIGIAADLAVAHAERRGAISDGERVRIAAQAGARAALEVAGQTA